MTIAIYTLTSSLHDEAAVSAISSEFLDSIGIEYEFKGSDFSSYSSHDLDLIYVRTGGTEGLFKAALPELRAKAGKAPILLLTSGKSNSLAASMEIMSYLRQQGLKGEILHGSPDYLRERINALVPVIKAVRRLDGRRLGVIGKPSDWLISSMADYAKVQERLGLEIIDIPMEVLLDKFKNTSQPKIESEALGSCAACVKEAYPDAMRLYLALKSIVAEYALAGLTIRCFDLLTAVHNTGCVALSRLNASGIAASCEGDVPALLSMVVSQALFGVSGFQCNLSRIDSSTNEYLFAHCTVPLDMVTGFQYDTHYESGIGVGIHGNLPEGPVTIFKLSGDLQRRCIFEGELLRNQYKDNLCRTQVIVRLPDGAKDYFLKDPIGNHHIIIPGHRKSELEAFLQD